MTRIEEARQTLLETDVNLKMEEIQTEEAYGRVIAENITAKTEVPSFRRSAYDGYAVRREDLKDASKEYPVTLKVRETIPAGSRGKFPVTEGTAARIMTGAMVPEGADAVVKHEDTRFTEKEVCFFMPAGAANIVDAGEDIKQGVSLIRKGKILGAADTAVIAGQGMSRVRVFQKPRIAILSTGNELTEPGQELVKGKIYNTNPFLLAGYVQKYGMIPKDYGIVPDETDVLADRIQMALNDNDMVITTGGVSAGDFDYVPKVMELIGADILFHRIPMKLGGAMLAAVKDGKVILGLSGNPGAAAVGFLHIGLPYMKKLCGRNDIHLTKAQAILAAPFEKSSKVTRILRGTAKILEGRLVFEQTGNQKNGAVSSMMDCNLLGEIPAGSPALPAGTEIDVYVV